MLRSIKLQPENQLHEEISWKLYNAQLKHQHHAKVFAGFAHQSEPHRQKDMHIYADFLIFDSGKPRFIIEAKANGNSHSIASAIGQCTLYALETGLYIFGEKPLRNCAICLPKYASIPEIIGESCEKLGIRICESDELVAICKASLDQFSEMPL